VLGTYLHGCFASGPLRRALLAHAATRRGAMPDARWGVEATADRYDVLADRVGAALDLEALGRLVRRPLTAETAR
jgi:cobyric acid synthase